MPEEKKDNVQEVVQPSEGSVAANSEPPQENVPEQANGSSEDHNWKEVREIMRQQKQKISDLEDELYQKKAPKPIEEDPFASLSDDDVVTVGDTKKIVASLAKKAAAEIVEERYRKQSIEEVPSRYDDYADVIKLVDEYVKENPTAEQAIMNSPNPRLTAYQMVKSSNLYHRRANGNSAQKAIDNSKKPLSSQSVGTTSPLNEVGRYQRMTRDRAAEVRKQAEEYASRRQ